MEARTYEAEIFSSPNSGSDWGCIPLCGYDKSPVLWENRPSVLFVGCGNWKEFGSGWEWMEMEWNPILLCMENLFAKMYLLKIVHSLAIRDLFLDYCAWKF